MAPPANVLVLAELDDDGRLGVERACADAGFAAVIESAAEAAMSKLTTKRFDAFVVHLGTPGAALACMRTRGKLLRVRVPVLALVDDDTDGAFARAYRAGADEVLPVGHPDWLASRLRSLPRPTIPQPGNARGDAVVADADRGRAEVVERVLRDAGFRVEVAVDGFSTRLQAGRPALKVAVVDASLEDVPGLIQQTRAKGARCAWVVRCRPEQLDELRRQLAGVSRVAIVSAYGPPEDVLFETNRLVEARASDGRADARLLHGTVLRLKWGGDGGRDDIGYSYNVSSLGLYVRTLVAPAAETVEIDVTPPGGDRPVHLECKVVWRREFGTTRKEPVPAGFGVQVAGGDVDAWAEACPRVPSLRHAPLSAAEASEASPLLSAGKVPVARISLSKMPAVGLVPRPGEGAPAASLSVPTEVTIRPRARQPSVEEMLQSVLAETIPSDPEGAAPLSIDGESVVELPDGADTAAPGEGLLAEPAAADAPTHGAMDSVIPSAPPSESPGRRSEPSDITPSSLGFDLSEDAVSLPPSHPEAQRAPAPPDAYGDTVRPDSAAGLDVFIPKLPAPSPLSLGARSDLPVDTARAESPAVGAAGPPGESVAGGRAAFAATMVAPASTGAAPSAPAVASPSDLEESGSEESDVPAHLPTRRVSPAVWVAVAVVVGGVAALVFPKRQPAASVVAPGPVAALHAASSAAPPPSAAGPAASAAAAPVPPAVAAEPAASAAAPVSPAAAAEPVASAAAAPVSPAVAAEPVASAAAAPVPLPAADEPDAAALRSLQKGFGFLYVESPLATNLYAYGLPAGTTNQRITSKCGPRFLRLGTAPGHWQGEGWVQIVKCGGFTRLRAPE